MKNFEIPLKPAKTRTYRWLERLPAILSYSLIATPLILSQISARATVLFVLAYLLMWFIRAVAVNFRVIQGWNITQQHQKFNWAPMIQDVQDETITVNNPKWHAENIKRLETQPGLIKPDDVVHLVIVAIYNESRDIVEPTIKSVIKSNYDMKKVMLVIAYEERGPEDTRKLARDLVKEYKDNFMFAEAIEHPKDMPHEVVGKGGNITYAGRIMQKRIAKMKYDPNQVVVTTLDSDNRPHKNYFAALTYTYSLCPEPKYISFQPIVMYTNNIWDAPALMRVIATGNSFWNIILTMRPHIIRNFSSHAQNLRALIDTDFWSVRTIVEDGHQFWRTYFRYDGKHEAYPIYIPIYQDAVLAEGYRRTLKAQFIQIRRWAYGASDIPFVITKGFANRKNMPRFDLLAKAGRLVESHLSWATAPLLITFSGFIPILFNPDNLGANNLPTIVSYIHRVAMIGLVVTMFLSFKSLPPKPARYKRHRNIIMLVQWLLLPISTIVYSSSAALNSQTRLFLGKYLDKFEVTEKAVKK